MSSGPAVTLYRSFALVGQLYKDYRLSESTNILTTYAIDVPLQAPCFLCTQNPADSAYALPKFTCEPYVKPTPVPVDPVYMEMSSISPAQIKAVAGLALAIAVMAILALDWTVCSWRRQRKQAKKMQERERALLERIKEIALVVNPVYCGDCRTRMRGDIGVMTAGCRDDGSSPTIQTADTVVEMVTENDAGNESTGTRALTPNSNTSFVPTFTPPTDSDSGSTLTSISNTDVAPISSEPGAKPVTHPPPSPIPSQIENPTPSSPKNSSSSAKPTPATPIASLKASRIPTKPNNTPASTLSSSSSNIPPPLSSSNGSAPSMVSVKVASPLTAGSRRSRKKAKKAQGS